MSDKIQFKNGCFLEALKDVGFTIHQFFESKGLAYIYLEDQDSWVESFWLIFSTEDFLFDIWQKNCYGYGPKLSYSLKDASNYITKDNFMAYIKSNGAISTFLEIEVSPSLGSLKHS